MGAICGLFIGLCVSVVLAALIVFISFTNNGNIQAARDSAGAVYSWPSLLLVPTGIVVGLAGPINNERKRRQQAKEREEASREHAKAVEERRRWDHQKAQQRYRNEMTTLGEGSLTLFESMPHLLRSAERYLDQAEIEFADGAFAPFWDCIENAAQLLARFDEGIGQIKSNLVRYKYLDEQYEDVSPSFLLAHTSVTKLAVASTSAERMQAIVRRAQRDFQFATIYEQRKTNQILIAGFTNLAQALSNMTWQITTSIDDLAQSVESMGSTLHEDLGSIHSRLDDVAETASKQAAESSKAASQAAIREEKVLEMLDNIQGEIRPSP